MVIQILLYLAISCFLTKQQIRAIHLIINELRFIRCVSLVTVSPVITHAARHSYGTILAHNRVPESYIGFALGHSNKSVTGSYIEGYSIEDRLQYNSLLQFQ